MAITAWDSEGMDWTASFDGKQWYPYIEALRQGLNEKRYLDPTPTYSASNAMTWSLDGIMPTVGSTLSDGFGYAFEYILNQTVPMYVNHTDESNWDTSSSKALMWSMADILTHLSETRITLNSGDLVTEDWIKQQYRIINLLRWKRVDLGFGALSDGREGQGTASTYSTAKTNAESDFASSGSVYSGTIREIAIGHYDSSAPDVYNVDLITAIGTLKGVIQTEFAADVDVYIYPQSTQLNPSYGAINSLSPMTIDRYNYFETLTIAKSDPTTLYTSTIGSATRQPDHADEPASVGDFTHKGYEFQGTFGYFVVKYNTDATNGFQYIA